MKKCGFINCDKPANWQHTDTPTLLCDEHYELNQKNWQEWYSIKFTANKLRPSGAAGELEHSINKRIGADPMSLDNLIDLIQAEIDAAEQHLQQLVSQMQELEQDGVYPDIPRIEWQSRTEGDGSPYMYLVFSQDRVTGKYPLGKRKLYIGSSDKRQAKAQRKLQNTDKWNKLENLSNNLSHWISRKQAELSVLINDLNRLQQKSQQWRELFIIKEKNSA